VALRPPSRLGRLILRVTGGKPVSKKVISQSFGHFLGLVVAYAVARMGLSLPVEVSGVIAGGVSIVSGYLAGYIAREEGLAG
jgi:hypothetical protein